MWDITFKVAVVLEVTVHEVFVGVRKNLWKKRQNIPSDLVLDFCGVTREGCVPTSSFSSVSNAGNMLCRISQRAADHTGEARKTRIGLLKKLPPSTTPTVHVCSPYAMLENLVTSGPPLPTQPLLGQAGTRLVILTMRPGNAPAESGRAAGFPASSWGAGIHAGPMLPCPCGDAYHQECHRKVQKKRGWRDPTSCLRVDGKEMTGTQSGLWRPNSGVQGFLVWGRMVKGRFSNGGGGV